MIFTDKKNLEQLGDFIKVVVDVHEKRISVGCDLHIDCAEELLRDGSISKNLWGANIYLNDKRIDFISLINIKPSEDNRLMEIQNPGIREQVTAIIKEQLFQ